MGKIPTPRVRRRIFLSTRSNPLTVILKPKRGHIEFLASAMESLSYLPWISGAAQPKLTQDRLRSIAIAVPPRHEQDQIVASLAEATLGIDAAARYAQQQIDLLREYRTRLIADVVTGKLDVRGAAARLPSPNRFPPDGGGGFPHHTLNDRHTVPLE